MTVSASTSRADYTGNGLTTAFPVPFYFLDNTHLKVQRKSLSTGAIATLALTTDYTVTGAGSGSGGTVTMAVAPTADQKLSIVRNVPQDQQIHYVPNDPFPAASHEMALDKLTMQVQQLNEMATRAIRFAATDNVDGEMQALSLFKDHVLTIDAATGLPVPSAFTTTQLASTIAAAFSGSAGPLAALSFLAAGTGAVSRGAQDKVRERISVFDFMTAAQIADVIANTHVVDVTAAIQAAATAANGREVFFPAGTYLVSSVITWPTDSALAGESRNRSIIYRSTTHTGHTFVFGQDVPGLHAGAMAMRRLWMHRPQTFNGGSPYIAGTSTSVDNRLTGSQAHVFIHECARGLIEDCSFDFMPYNVVLSGGSVSTITKCHFAGSISDQLTAGLQEGIAMLWLKVTAAGQVPTLITSLANYFSGDERSAVRSVTIGTTTSSYAENIGAKYGIKVDCCEGFDSIGDYFGGQNTHSIYVNPISTNICTNIRLLGGFHDGARGNCIDFDNRDAGGAGILTVIANNIFNGETVAQRAIGFEQQFGTPSAYNVSIVGNVGQAFLFAPLYIAGAVGVKVSDNLFSAYNCRGGNTGDPLGSAGAYVVGSGTGCADKIFFNDNAWGGGANTLGAVNNCQWGAYFQGTFATSVSAPSERSMGLGLAGGGLYGGSVADPAGAWTQTTPTPVPGTGAFGAGITATFRYLQIGKLVHFETVVTFGATGQGTGATYVAVPLPVAPKGYLSATGRANGVSGKQLIGGSTLGGTFVLIRNYDGTYPGSNTEILAVSGTYEAA